MCFVTRVNESRVTKHHKTNPEMERISNLTLKLCSSCFKLVSQSASCMDCAGKRLFSRASLKAAALTGPTLSKSFGQIPPSKLGTLNTLLSNVNTRHSLTAGSILLHRFQQTSFRQQNGVLPLLLSSSSTRLFSTSPSGPKLPPKKKSRDNSSKSTISWKNLLIVTGIGGAILLMLRYAKAEKELERQKARNLKMGKAKLGGDWTLTDHHGKKRSSTDFRGQWILIYFGFTNCPDICPEEIEKIVNVIERTDADKDLPEIQPIIITVDPDRDTPEALKEYCAEFSPRLLGFTGSQEEISQATRVFRVYFSAGPKDEDNDYIVDHSIISYLMNPKGEFVDYFGQNKTADEMYKSIKFHIATYMRRER